MKTMQEKVNNLIMLIVFLGMLTFIFATALYCVCSCDEEKIPDYVIAELSQRVGNQNCVIYPAYVAKAEDGQIFIRERK